MAEPADSGKPAAAKQSQQSNDMFASCKYMKVVFQQKTNPNEPDDVVLSVQNFAVKCKRGVETIVPDFILEAADNAVYTKWSVEPGQGRKVAARIRKFPYQVLGDTTRKEFQDVYQKGTQQTRRAVAAHGLKIPIEQAVAQDE